MTGGEADDETGDTPQDPTTHAPGARPDDGDITPDPDHGINDALDDALDAKIDDGLAETSSRVTIVGEPESGDPLTLDPLADPRFDPVTVDPVDPDEPRLASNVDAPPPPVESAPAPKSGAVPSAAAYRSPDERNRSVYRRANPWYRRLARGIVALTLIAALAAAVYFGARAVQDWLNRDQLPPPGPEIPDVRETTILVASTSSALPLQGTLSFDTQSGAFEFVGLAGSPNATDRLTSPDGGDVYIANPNATWRLANEGDEIVATVQQAISVLSDANTADEILTNRLRNGFVELVDQTEEGPESDQLDRYDVALDLTAFAESFPLQWGEFQQNSIPGVQESRRHVTSLWLDDESVLVRIQDEETGWNWERLAYSADEYVAFRPPATQVVDPGTQEVATGIDCRIDALQVDWATTLPTCEDSTSVGRQLAASVGLGDAAEAPEAELAFASVCGALQGGEPRTFEDQAYLELAGLLVDAGVCPGDTSLVVIAVDG